LIKAGFYYEQLLPYFSLFKRENIKVFFYSDLDEDPVKYIENLYEFLDVDIKFLPKITQTKVNIGINPDKNKNARLVLRFRGTRLNFIYHQLEKMFPSGTKEIRNEIPQSKVTQYSELYYQKNKDLDNLVSRNLKHWYENAA